MRRVLAVALALSLWPAVSDAADQVQLYAAGSLRTAFDTIAASYEKATGVRVIAKYGASGLLRDELAGGAHADLFASANMEHPFDLSRAGKSGPVVLFARNQLCALARSGLAIDPARLLDSMLQPSIKLGTSTPTADPSGDYAWEVFRKANAIRPGAYETLSRKALKLTGGPGGATAPSDRNLYGMLVAQGRADLFLTYCTNALAAVKENPGQQMVTLPDNLAVGADYGLTVMTGASPQAYRFAMFVLSPDAQRVLARFRLQRPRRPALSRFTRPPQSGHVPPAAAIRGTLMRLGYFTMPVHPMHRSWTDTLKQDREAIILADKLGFSSAFVGEHLTDRCENVTNSMTFLATLIPETKQIKLASGTANLAHKHPVLIAAQAAMFDHLAEGRFIFGISPGALTSDAEALGILDQDRNKIFAEAIDVILAIWEGEPPYNIDLPDNRFKVSIEKTAALHLGVGYMGKPYQQPRPEICGTVVAPFSPGVVQMGKRDFHPLSANFLLAQHVKTHWQNYCKGKAEVGVEPDTGDWRVARTIFVADDDKVAERYGRSDAASPYSFYYSQMHAKMKRGKRLYVFKRHKDQADEEITHDFVMDELVIHGSVNKVVDGILALHEEIGDFGELVYGGMDWVDPALARRSMQLLAEEVMPRVNAAIGKKSAAA